MAEEAQGVAAKAHAEVAEVQAELVSAHTFIKQLQAQLKGNNKVTKEPQKVCLLLSSRIFVNLIPSNNARDIRSPVSLKMDQNPHRRARTSLHHLPVRKEK